LNNLKKQYFFIIDFFLPENKNLLLKEFQIVSEIEFLHFIDYIIYPVEYKGFFNASSYVLLNREAFLYKDKKNFLDKIYDNFMKGENNIYSLNFKNLTIRIKPYIDEFDFGNDYIALKYEFLENPGDFWLILTQEFIYSFLKGLLNERTKKKASVSELLSYLKLRLYRDSITSFWDLNNFIKELANKETQSLLNLLLKNIIVEETMLAGFIAGFKDSALMTKLIDNLSINVRGDVQKSLNSALMDYRWVQESTYLVRTGIEKLIFENKLSLPHLKYITNIKEKIKKERYQKFFQDKSYEHYLNDAYEDNLIEKIKVKVDRKSLLMSLKGCKETTIKYFLNTLSLNAQNEFKEDMLHYHTHVTEEKLLETRIKVIEALKSLYYEKKAEDLLLFKPIIFDLNSLNLNLLIEEAGVLKFAQATYMDNKELKKHIIFAVKGVVRLLFVDLYEGKVRFKSGFGEATIRALKKEILKTYYFLKDNGKMI